jgi:hypothetical protein
MRKKDKQKLDEGLGIAPESTKTVPNILKETEDSNKIEDSTKDILEGEVLSSKEEIIPNIQASIPIPTQITTPTTVPMVLNQSNITMEFDEKDEQSDYDLNRKTLRNILVKGEDVLEDMVALAKDDETPRAYEVLGGLMKNLAEISGNLMDIHEKRKRIRQPSKNAIPQENQTPMNIQGDNTTVFVGTPADILKQLKGRGKPEGNG